MDVLDLHDRARASTARIVTGVEPGQLGLATPCVEWDVGAVLGHLVGGNRLFAHLAAGNRMEGPLLADPVALRALATDDPAGAYEETARMVAEIWREPGALERTVPMPFGPVPGPFAVTLHFVDTLVHGWDLARATGQDTHLDPEVAGAALAFARENLPGAMRGPGRPFGLEVPTTSTSVGDRLVAFMGRTP